MRPESLYFSYFSPIHLYSFIFSIGLSVIFLIIPKLYKKINIEKYATFLGIFILFFKLLDSVYRIIYQYEPVYNVIPIHLCNFAAVAAGIYLISRNHFFFNLLYFLSFGAAFALILPGVTYYYNPVYVYIFMIMHALEFVGVIYGFVYLKEKITFKNFIGSCVVLLGLFLFSHFYNLKYNTNAMFLNDYIAPMASFIKPFILYKFILIISMLLIMFLMYLPFSKRFQKKNNYS
ncbi:TIGR02206 family membrane protein [Leptotrichia sp. OH3620_COT-345]|uniref:YwaF family protein n=1 Tax=Leptotrichia sp. OH3620_COT-345 TaxID=2491048 RepID=UPI000F646A0C|nr:TIGR02206 family membrane protein [Leptotrichia sp. OH3620_COT-345]RRD40741.1 TIGR02206 family membrane protein [Leptotrichia sp. OH3620_COT-345]